MLFAMEIQLGRFRYFHEKKKNVLNEYGIEI